MMNVTFEQLRNKARYGHRAYVYWTDRAGILRFSPYGRSGLKEAILSVGAKGRIYWLDSGGNSNIARSFSYMLHLWRCAGPSL